MEDSSYDQSFPWARARTTAVGHYVGGAPIAGKWRIIAPPAVAGLWTTPSDLARLVIDLQRARRGQTARILTKESVDQLLTPQTPAVGPAYGLGVELYGQGAALCFGHGGDNIGYKCAVYALAERGLGLVVMTNGDAGARVCEEVFHAVAQEYAWWGNRTDAPKTASNAATLFRRRIDQAALAVYHHYLRVLRR